MLCMNCRGYGMAEFSKKKKYCMSSIVIVITFDNGGLVV